MSAAELFVIPGFADPFSSLSHLLAAAAFAVLGVQLVQKGLRVQPAHGSRRQTGRILSLAIFAASAVVLLTLSGVFHLLEPGPARAALKRLDHAAIFTLIAGTCTPIFTIMFRGPVRWGMLAGIWTIAATGVTLKSIYFASVSPTLGIQLYLGMGWIGALSIFSIWRRRGGRFVLPLLLGGLAYTLGAAVEWAEPAPVIDGVIRAHEVFHVAVVLGLALQWRFIWRISDLQQEASEPIGPPTHDALHGRATPSALSAPR